MGFPYQPDVGSFVALLLDSTVSSLIVILFSFFWGGMSLSATLSLEISIKHREKFINNSFKFTEKYFQTDSLIHSVRHKISLARQIGLAERINSKVSASQQWEGHFGKSSIAFGEQGLDR